VECDYHGKGKWFPARIANVRKDDTYDVIYDDGDKESKIIYSKIRLLEKVEHIKKKVCIYAYLYIYIYIYIYIYLYYK
jgi:hypothetical protein